MSTIDQVLEFLKDQSRAAHARDAAANEMLSRVVISSDKGAAIAAISARLNTVEKKVDQNSKEIAHTGQNIHTVAGIVGELGKNAVTAKKVVSLPSGRKSTRREMGRLLSDFDFDFRKLPKSVVQAFAFSGSAPGYKPHIRAEGVIRRGFQQTLTDTEIAKIIGARHGVTPCGETIRTWFTKKGEVFRKHEAEIVNFILGAAKKVAV